MDRYEADSTTEKRRGDLSSISEGSNLLSTAAAAAGKTRGNLRNCRKFRLRRERER